MSCIGLCVAGSHRSGGSSGRPKLRSTPSVGSVSSKLASPQAPPAASSGSVDAAGDRAADRAGEKAKPEAAVVRVVECSLRSLGNSYS